MPKWLLSSSHSPLLFNSVYSIPLETYSGHRDKDAIAVGIVWEPDAVEWRLALPRLARVPRRPHALQKPTQLVLFPDDRVRTARG